MNPLDHRFVKRLLPEYLDELSDLEAKKTDLEATIKGASGDEDEEETDDGEDQLSEEELKALKRELSGVKKTLKTKEGNFTKRLKGARTELDETGARELVLGILRADLDGILGRYVAEHRQHIVAAFENWWDKYRVTLTSIEQERDGAAEKLRSGLGDLGYG